MAYTTIKKPSDYFSADTWSGNSSTQSIDVGKNFSSNGSLIWIKGRNSSGFSHRLIDSVRAKENLLSSHNTDAEFTESGDGIASYSSTGFNLQFSSQNDYNESGGNYVGWNWLAGSSPTGSSNTDGSITSTVSANTTSGFSIVSYTGTGANATIGHGLGVAPKVVITKNRDTADNWLMYHASTGNTGVLYLNETFAFGTSSAYWNNTSPTSSVFSVGTEVPMNKSGDSIIAYCFAEKKGFSKFGSYTGNGNADGPFVYTGFKPAFVIIKVSSTTNDWSMYDNQRDPINQVDNYLQPNTTSAEVSDTGKGTDFLSNGFKLRTTHGTHNTSGATYIYMAFAEEPLVGDNPATAR